MMEGPQGVELLMAELGAAAHLSFAVTTSQALHMPCCYATFPVSAR
jgi:hypothetical protein